jgi:hypothetical protein
MGGEMARNARWLGPLVVVLAGAVGGLDAAVAALVGAVLATVVFWVTGWAMSWSARRSPQTLGAVAMGGFFARLVGLTIVLWIALRVLHLDILGLALGLGVTYVVLLVLQARKELVAR